MRRAACRSLLLLASIAWLAGGCTFRMEHQLPQGAYFGHFPVQRGAEVQRFQREGTKSFALAGLVPYSGWGAADLLSDAGSSERIEDLEIETRFSALDTAAWLIPGLAYGGYLFWAPRTLSVRGSRVVRPINR